MISLAIIPSHHPRRYSEDHSARRGCSPGRSPALELLGSAHAGKQVVCRRPRTADTAAGRKEAIRSAKWRCLSGQLVEQRLGLGGPTWRRSIVCRSRHSPGGQAWERKRTESLPAPRWPQARSTRWSSTSMFLPMTVAVIIVQWGCRRRSVGEPGFSKRRPPGDTVSQGMWE